MNPIVYWLLVAAALFIGHVWNAFEIDSLKRAGPHTAKKIKELELWNKAYISIIATIGSAIIMYLITGEV